MDRWTSVCEHAGYGRGGPAPAGEWVGQLRHAAQEVERQGQHGCGHLLQLAGVTGVPDRELWTSFPEATRNDILRLLGMLLKRGAVSAGLTAEVSRGEHRAAG
jgi:hypothetical protein